MSSATRDVVVTGTGVVCSIAHDCGGLLAAIERGDCGIAEITRFDTSQFDVHLGAEVKNWPRLSSGEQAPSHALCLEFSVRAAMEALEGVRGATESVPPERLALVFGTGLVDAAEPIHELTRSLAGRIGAEGPRITVSTACSSSTAAIGIGRDLIAMGSADAVLAGGADVLSSSVFAGFHALGVLSREKCAPFSFPFGTTLGEGAGFLLIERGDAARRRGAPVIARLSGFGLSADAYHETSPDPKGSGVERALGSALEDAMLRPEDVGYVNAHGSGTEANDPSEWQGIRRALRPVASLPVSSTKGALGHSQGAAGVLETIATIVTMSHHLLAPTINFVGPRRLAPPDPVAGPHPRPGAYTHAITVNSAFGGSNAALVLSRPLEQASEPRMRKAVEVRGLGLVGPWGLGLDAFGGWERSPTRGRVPPFDIADLVPRTDPRGLDPSSRYLIAASALAFRDAGVTLRGALRDESGMIMGAIRPSPASLAAFAESVHERGLLGLSAAAFARIVLNAPAGFCAKALGLRGPHCAVTTGWGSGLAAIILAAELLSTREGVAFMLGAAVDERPPSANGGRDPSEAAVSVLLAHRDSPSASNRGSPIRLAGWGIAGPGALADAVRDAHCCTDGDAGRPDLIFDERALGEHPQREGAAPSALVFAQAIVALRRGEGRRALVTSDVGDALSVAAILIR